MSPNEPLEVPSGPSAAKDDAKALPLLPLRNTVLFPHLFVPLSVGRPASVAAVESALVGEDKTFLVTAQKSTDNDQPEYADLHTVATRAVVKKMVRHDSVIELIVQGIERVRLLGVEKSEPFLEVRYEPYPLPTDEGDELEALQRAIVDLALKVMELAQVQTPVTVQQLVAQASDPLRFAFLLGSMLALDVAKEQALAGGDDAPRGADAAAQLPQPRVRRYWSCVSTIS